MMPPEKLSVIAPEARYWWLHTASAMSDSDPASVIV